jgi:tRNA nucleotidyltransferase (CCA-adding enzyme)
MDNYAFHPSFIQQLDLGRQRVSIISSEDHFLKNIPSRLESTILNSCRSFSLPVVDIVPVGSSQRQTYLPGNRDIDIFVRLDTSDRSLLENFASLVIPSLASSLHATYEIKYAENPYGTLFYPFSESEEVIAIDIVVTIWIPSQELLPKILPLSGMARTPFHMFYLKEKIKGLEEEVRLFKLWSKQKKLYRQSGFTGFISELLIIIFGSFSSILSKASEIASFTYDFHGRSLTSVKKKFFNYPIVLIDPVDPNRNAAAGIHGVLGDFHLARFKRVALESISNPDTLWEEYVLQGFVFNLKIDFTSEISIKNNEEYYSRIIKVLGLLYRALFDSQIEMLDAIIDVSTSTLSFTTNSLGGTFILVKGPPVHLNDHVQKFISSNPEHWIEKGFYWTKKPQMSVQELTLTKLSHAEAIKNLLFI